MKSKDPLVSRFFRLLGHCGPVIRRHRMQFALCFLLSLILTGLELLRPQPLRILFDGLLLPNPDGIPAILAPLGLLEWSPTALIALVCGSVLAIGIGIGVVNYGLEVNLAYLGNKMMARIRKMTFRHLIALPNIFHDSQKTGDLVLRLTGDILLLRDLLVNFVVSFFGRITLLVGLLALMFVMNVKLAVIALVLIPAISWATMRATKLVGSYTRKQRKQESKIAQSVHELIGEMRVFAAYGNPNVEDKHFSSVNRGSFRSDVKSRKVRARLSGTTEVTLGVSICLVLGIGTLDVIEGRMSAGELLVFVSYLRTLFKPIRSLTNLVGRTGKALACAERVIDILETPISIQDSPDAVKAPTFEGRIAFRGVDLTYGKKSHALSQIDLVIEAGETVGITGPSGSGKTSLCHLIPRLYDPDSGVVEIDGTDIRKYKIRSLREQISLVLQDPGIFHLSVAENVAFGREEWTPVEVEEACRYAEIHEDILKMPKGYDTLVGERGSTISGGQRRRIALARALLRDPRILILDEPFEGLDKAVADSVAKTIHRIAHGRTVLLVSHQAEHLAPCSRIIEIREGGISKDTTETKVISPFESKGA